MVYPYEILGVAENADQSVLRKAYLSKVREYPPEQAPAMFSAIVDAYTLVKDEKSRAKVRVFGLPGKQGDDKLAGLVVHDRQQRDRIGVQAWLDLLKEIDT